MKSIARWVAGSAGLLIALAGCARIAPPPSSTDQNGVAIALTNTQLDGVTAGAKAFAAGAGEGEGLSASSAVILYTVVGLGNPRNTAAIGRVTSNASSRRPEIPAAATSVLHLSIEIP